MKVLLLTLVPPTKDSTGGLFQDQLCRFFKPGQLCCFSLQNHKLKELITPDLDWIPITYYPRPRETVPAIVPSVFAPIFAFLIFFYNQFLTLPPMVRAVVKFGRLHRVTHIWCVFEGQCMTRIASKVARLLKIPLITQLWDPPEWGVKDLKLDPISSHFYLGAVAKAMKQSEFFAAPSWALGEEYSRKFGVPSVAIIPSLEASQALFPKPQIHSAQQLVIGIAGKIYAIDEWNALLKALSMANWVIGDRQVVIRHLGNAPKIPEHLRQRIAFLGWKTQDETILEMSRADILYCPYGFNSTFELAARYSFPAKLTTYLASGRAVFFHGPEYSSPWKFLDKHQAGIASHSLDEAEILRKIQQLVTDADFFSRICRNGNRSFHEFLTTEKMREKFLSFPFGGQSK